MDRSKKRTNLLGAFIVGASVGVALGILLAPDKGSVTFKKLESKGDDLASELKAQINEILAGVTIESVLEKANELLESGKTKLEKNKP